MIHCLHICVLVSLLSDFYTSCLVLSHAFLISILFLFSFYVLCSVMCLNALDCVFISISCYWWFFLCLRVELCSQSPCSGLSVSWLKEGSQSVQHKHDTVSKWDSLALDCGKQSFLSVWTRLSSQICFWNTLAANTTSCDNSIAAPSNLGQMIGKVRKLLSFFYMQTLWRLMLINAC